MAQDYLIWNSQTGQYEVASGPTPAGQLGPLLSQGFSEASQIDPNNPYGTDPADKEKVLQNWMRQYQAGLAPTRDNRFLTKALSRVRDYGRRTGMSDANLVSLERRTESPILAQLAKAAQQHFGQASSATGSLLNTAKQIPTQTKLNAFISGF